MLKGKSPKKTQEFRDQWDKLAEQYCNPLERLFVFAQNADGKYGFDVASKACAELLAYRYAKLKNIELSLEAQLGGDLQITWQQSQSHTPPDGIKPKPTKKNKVTGSGSKSGTAAQGKQSGQ